MEKVFQTEPELADCRAALQHLLDSPVFSGSRRLSDFLAYAGQAALEGRSTVDQYEIAERVLGRAGDFNPWDDATVRKLATQLRHKLEEYYSGPGAADRVLVSLPKRSYVLRFRLRDEEEPAPVPPPVELPPLPDATPEAEAAVPAPLPAAASGYLSPVWYLCALCVALPAGWFLLGRSEGSLPEPAAVSGRQIVIRTAGGDIRGKVLDAAPDAVQLGPELRPGEEAVLRLQFSPDHPTQQAGLMALVDSDHFVRLGRHFKNRTLLEFGMETGGQYQISSSTYEFDPLGQSGLPIWMAIRRTGDDYQGFLSSDGFYWRSYGAALQLPAGGKPVRAALYAFNGRSSNPSATAQFERFGSALAFHNRPDGALRAEDFGGWSVESACRVPASVNIREQALEAGFPPEAVGCEWFLGRPLPQGDWSFSTLIDFEPVSGSSAALMLRGSRRNLSITRRDLDGGALMLERFDDQDTRIPDFRGTPPVILRLDRRGSAIQASVSRDGAVFVPVGSPVPVSEIGDPQRIGVRTSVAHWTSAVSRPPVRVYWIREDPPATVRLR